jgi:hypothetical protein
VPYYNRIMVCVDKLDKNVVAVREAEEVTSGLKFSLFPLSASIQSLAFCLNLSCSRKTFFQSFSQC